MSAGMKHVMVDLETLGTKAGCAILSIGAVYFDVEQGLGSEMYTVVYRPSCVDAGLHEDQDTLTWWNRQSPEAKKVLIEANDETIAHTLTNALEELRKFIKLSTSVKVWGNGADFDNAILIAAHHAVNTRQSWGNFNGRCYRTIKNLFPAQKLTKDAREGTHHNALDDAKSQAIHLIQLAKNNKLVLG